MFADRFTVTPEASLGLSDSHCEVSLGWRLELAPGNPGSLELGLTGARGKGVNDDAAEPVHALMLRGSRRW